MMRRAEYGDYGGGRRTERDLDQYNDRPAGGYGYGGGGGGDRAVDRGDAPPRKFGRRDDPDEQKRKMFCGGLSLETTKDAVERYFTRFGPIQEVIMVPELVHFTSQFHHTTLSTGELVVLRKNYLV